jgi:hypothetical protein
MSRTWVWLQTSRSVRLLAFALSACVFAFALRLAWLAFSYPLEIEIREGSVWLHALARRAGVDLYDTTRVAFVNMNHGPLDPILKGWIAEAAPALPGHMVTRVFVLGGPIVLLASATVITRGHLAAALLAAGTLFLVFCHLSTMIFVGRSDATAICFLVLCGTLAHRILLTYPNWSRARCLAQHVCLGMASAAVFLTSWRYAPIAAALQIAAVAVQPRRRRSEGPCAARPSLGKRVWAAVEPLAISAALQLVGFAAVWVPLFVIELHADLGSYYRHFFGFFVDNSGWGTLSGPAFQLLPPELLATRQPSLVFLFALVLWGLCRLRQDPRELGTWLVLLAAAWVAVTYGYFKNLYAGGLHYFFAFLILAWTFILHAFCRRRRWGALTQILLVAVAVLALPYRDLLAREKMLVEMRQQAVTFHLDAARLTYGYSPFGEETHLFKLVYQGETVDTGDTDNAIANSGYFGEAFTRTYQAYVRALTANPPKFVIGGLLNEDNPERIMSPALQDLLKRRYTIRLRAPGSAFATGGSQALFERND